MDINTVEVSTKPVLTTDTVSLLEKTLRGIGIWNAKAFSTQLFSFAGDISKTEVFSLPDILHHRVTQDFTVNAPLDVRRREFDFAIRVDYKPGVTDNSARVVRKDLSLVGVPEVDDVNITKQQIVDNYAAFGFKSVEDVALYEKLLTEGFGVISDGLDTLGKIFVDTKFEFGYVPGKDGQPRLIYIDEVGTPDSSRYWDKALYEREGVAKEESKELFREMLQAGVPDKDVLVNKARMDERIELNRTYRVPDEEMMEVSALYAGLARQITGNDVPEIGNAREEIIDSLASLNLIE